jgi:hypothetical protein
LSRLADHGLLWMVLAAALWATGSRPARRTAWRGLGSMAAASTAANVIGKGLTGRRRPYAEVPAPAQQDQPAEHPDHEQEQQTDRHEPRSCLNPPNPPNRRSRAMYRVLKRYRVKLVKVNVATPPSCSSAST